MLSALMTVALMAPPLPTVEAVTQKLDDLYRSKSSVARIRMEVKTKHFERALEIDAWSIGEDDALMVIRAPARERGTATLRTDEGLWNYAPRADRLMRIPSGMLSESWMGSHFTNDDLMRESSWDDDYDTTLDWFEPPDEKGATYLRATMIPKKNAAVVYTKVVQVLTADAWLPVRAEYYDGHEIVRRMHFEDVKVMGGRMLPTVMRVVPTDKPDELTRVVYERIEFDGKIDRDLFTPRGLRRMAQKR